MTMGRFAASVGPVPQGVHALRGGCDHPRPGMDARPPGPTDAAEGSPYSDVSARYSRLAATPVSSDTTEAAGRGFAPASTSRRSASSAGPISSTVDGAPPTTSATSPRGGSDAYRAASSAAV